MSTVKEIRDAIAALPAAERAELERMLHEANAAANTPVALPDQAARRRRIFGDKVLPNVVIAARAESA